MQYIPVLSAQHLLCTMHTSHLHLNRKTQHTCLLHLLELVVLLQDTSQSHPSHCISPPSTRGTAHTTVKAFWKSCTQSPSSCNSHNKIQTTGVWHKVSIRIVDCATSFESPLQLGIGGWKRCVLQRCITTCEQPGYTGGEGACWLEPGLSILNFVLQLWNGEYEFVGKRINMLKMVEVHLAGDYPTSHTLVFFWSNHQCWWSDSLFEGRIRLEELPLPVDWLHTGDGDPPKHCWYWGLWHSGTDPVTFNDSGRNLCVGVRRKGRSGRGGGERRGGGGVHMY